MAKYFLRFNKRQGRSLPPEASFLLRRASKSTRNRPKRLGRGSAWGAEEASGLSVPEESALGAPSGVASRRTAGGSGAPASGAEGQNPASTAAPGRASGDVTFEASRGATTSTSATSAPVGSLLAVSPEEGPLWSEG